MSSTSIVWLRNDLRLHDHEPLVRALERRPDRLAVVYCVDPRHFGRTREYVFPKTGPFRARFLLESLADLRVRLRSLGNDLIILRGKPEEVLPRLAESIGADSIHYLEEATDEELRVEQSVRAAAERASVACHGYWGATLFHRDDLPFDVSELPPVFTQFRVRCEKDARIRPPLATPPSMPPSPEAAVSGEVPTLSELGLSDPTDDPRAVLPFRGGESAALDRLDAYFWRNDRLKEYKQTRNGLLGGDYSSKFSPWLALGCLSPRFAAAEVARYEQKRVRNDSTYWLVFELMWRDYFRFLALKVGASLFSRQGPRHVRRSWTSDPERLQAWIEGRTGIPFVDANMRELLLTGFQSNRGRQNVASFLAKNLGIDWRAGAEWFESQLIDYDVCSNWGNWSYVAGVGNDPRQDRYFHVIKQARDYDPDGGYVKTWIPELARLSSEDVHEPWKMRLSPSLALDFGPDESAGYVQPIIDLDSSYDRLRAGQASAPGDRSLSFPVRKPKRKS
jgi:deoxyribodipyrimidine photo-lyase